MWKSFPTLAAKGNFGIFLLCFSCEKKKGKFFFSMWVNFPHPECGEKRNNFVENEGMKFARLRYAVNPPHPAGYIAVSAHFAEAIPYCKLSLISLTSASISSWKAGFSPFSREIFLMADMTEVWSQEKSVAMSV